jgi:micrococcal nuclease
MIFNSTGKIRAIFKLANILLMLSICFSCWFIIAPAIVSASLDEAYGMVTNVVDGDTFDVTIEKANEKVLYRVERIRLADVNSPEMDFENGPAARDFTYAVLMNKRVFLDIDDLSENGRDDYGRMICVAYLSGYYGQPIASPNFNRLLMDSGHASLDNFTNNEFDPSNWRSQQAPEIDAEPLQDLGSGLKKNFTEDLLPRLQESAGEELNKAAAESWEWLKGQIGAGIANSKA